MARIRTIKPEFFLDTELSELPIQTRHLFIGLWTLADREGRLEDNPKRIKAQIFPWDDLDVDMALIQLHPKFITRYEHNGHRYIQINNFCKHQRPNIKEAESSIPAPKHVKHEKESAKHENFHASTLDKGKGMDNGNGVGKGRVKGVGGLATTLSFSPPSISEVITYCLERKNNVNAQKWHDFYASKGWMIGKNKMKDWKAAVRTWEIRDGDGVTISDSQTCFKCGKNGLPPKGRSHVLNDKPICRDCLDKMRFS